MRPLSRQLIFTLALAGASGLSFQVHAQSQDPTPTSAATPAPAAPAAPTTPALEKALLKYLVILNEPVYVYNWFDATNRSAVWKTQFSASDPVALEHARDTAHSFFQSFCTGDSNLDPADCTNEDPSKLPGVTNRFGPGLYAATDPVATISYGGTKNWVLEQIRLPKDFRFLSLSWTVADDSISDEIKSELREMKCDVLISPSIRTLNSLVRSILTWGGGNGQHQYQGQSSCTLNLRNLLKERLRLEALYYEFNGSEFEVCSNQFSNGTFRTAPQLPGNYLRQGAFLITGLGTEKLKPEDVKAFNAQTRDATEDRVRISSVFYAAIDRFDESYQQKISDYYHANGIPNFPGYQIVRYVTTSCFPTNSSNFSCGDYYYITDGKTTRSVTLARPPGLTPTRSAETIMSAARLPRALAQHFNPPTLLWPDLEGHEVDPKIDGWIQTNLLGCRDIAPYGSVPNLRYGHVRPKSNLPPAAQ